MSSVDVGLEFFVFALPQLWFPLKIVDGFVVVKYSIFVIIYDMSNSELSNQFVTQIFTSKNMLNINIS